MNNHNFLLHIHWTTFDTLPIWDKNGNWNEFYTKYQILKERKIVFTTSKKIHENYNNLKSRTTCRSLSKNAITQLKEDIIDLSKPNKDRIIEQLEIRHIKITNISIEIILFSNQTDISQKIARLKSRTATLLHFNFPDEFTEARTWSKGYWQATIYNKKEIAFEIIKNELET